MLPSASNTISVPAKIYGQKTLATAASLDQKSRPEGTQNNSSKSALCWHNNQQS
ncbi:hypothetical protein PJE062_2505 [Pseudovibrio sp. JE062]|nr:hypothetical protein PJE062_2505 [Pseudovibrio sp. JE062]